MVGLLVLAVYRQATLGQLLATLVYGASLTAVYAASTFSHAIQEPRRKQLFRILDQAVIYCLIAGTYTPFISDLHAARSGNGRCFWRVWTFALWGFISKAFLKHRIEAVVVANYILLGWLPAMAMVSLIPLDCVLWMACGGILYTVGTLFLMFDQRVPFFHATWHAFVLVASALPFLRRRALHDSLGSDSARNRMTWLDGDEQCQGDPSDWSGAGLPRSRACRAVRDQCWRWWCGWLC